MKNTLIWTIIIFICASIFRLTNLDLIEFKLDEARDVYEMERFYKEPYFIQRGTIQSIGVYNPPLWYYILAVLSLPSRDPQYLSFIIALINCMAVAGFYLVVRKFYGQTVGIIAGLLMAFSPWTIIFSRKIWAPDLILPLAVLWFYFINDLGWQPESTPGVSKTKKKWAWLGLVFTLMLMVQLHASGIFLAVGTIIVLIILHLRGVKAHLGGVLLGLLISLIPLLPYIAYQFQNNCPDCQAYFAYQEGEALGAQPTFDSNAFIRPFQLINGSGFDDALGEEGFQQFQEQYPIIRVFNFLFLLEFLLLPVGVWHLISTRGSPQGNFPRLRSGQAGLPLGCWLVLVPLLVFLTKTPAHLYYFLILSPIVILIYALGLAHLRGVAAFFHLGGVLLAAIIVINIIFTLSFYQFLRETKVIPGDYGATYKVTKERAEEKGMKVEGYVISLYGP